jgi:hypothetical protein
MSRLKTVLGVALAVALCGASHAAFSYNIIQSDITFQPSGNVANVPFVSGGPQNNHVDHLTGVAGALVGDGSGNDSAVVTIIYDVNTNGGPANQLNLTILGAVFESGRIAWIKEVFDMNGNSLLSISGAFLGSSYGGGSDGAIVFNQSYGFSPVTQFKVVETFTLDINNQPLPSSSIAALTLVEQNWVPEPASMIALSAGLAGLVLRRRRK